MGALCSQVPDSEVVASQAQYPYHAASQAADDLEEERETEVHRSGPDWPSAPRASPMPHVPLAASFADAGSKAAQAPPISGKAGGQTFVPPGEFGSAPEHIMGWALSSAHAGGDDVSASPWPVCNGML